MTLKTKIIFIGGASASGKTTLAKALNEQLKVDGKSCRVLSMDDYYHLFSEEEYEKTFEHLTTHQLISDEQTAEEQKKAVFEYYCDTVDFDVYPMLNADLLHQDLSSLNQGKKITKGLFDFQTHRYKDYEDVEPTEFLVVEGLYATKFAKTLGPEFEKTTVFTSTSSFTDIKNRRMERDIKERPIERDLSKQNLDKEKKFVIKMLRNNVGPAFFGFPDPRTGESIASSMLGVDVHILNERSPLDIEDALPIAIKEGVHDILLTHRDYFITAVKKDGLLLRYASSQFKDDKEVVRAAVQQAGLEALQYASDNLQDDEQLKTEALLFTSKKSQHDQQKEKTPLFLLFSLAIYYPKTSSFILGLAATIIITPFTTLAIGVASGLLVNASLFAFISHNNQDGAKAEATRPEPAHAAAANA